MGDTRSIGISLDDKKKIKEKTKHVIQQSIFESNNNNDNVKKKMEKVRSCENTMSLK